MQLFELHFDLNLIRILLAFSMLFVASTVDIKKREINDMLWIVFGAIATVLVFLEPNLWSTITHIGFSMIIAPVALFVWRMGVFGGADALALITLAALVPYPNATFCDTNNTWVTPGIPYLIYITGGFLIQVFYGDIIFNFLRA